MSLNNLAGFLSDLGLREEALAVAWEAVDIRHALASARPDAFRPDLAMSLNNLAGFLSDLGQREEALAVAREAVELYRALAAARPDAFRPDLARSLSVLADQVAEREGVNKALPYDEEGIALLAPFFIHWPEAFVSLMVPLLQSYFERCEQLGREPDTALLAPILAALEQLRKQGDEDA